MANGRRLVPGPLFTPRPYGLWSVIQVPAVSPDHWEMGVTYEVTCPAASLTYDPCLAVTGTGGPPPPPPSKAATSEHALRGATAFTVVEEIDCSPIGFYDDATAKASDALTRSEMRQVEAAFWTGSAGNQQVVWPHLAAQSPFVEIDGTVMQTAAITGVGVAVDVVEGLGILEGKLADCYDGVGVLHVPVELIPALGAYNLVERSGAQLRTKTGNLIAVGAGYSGTSPSGTSTAGVLWMYATGALFGLRSDIRAFPTDQSFDRSVNTVKAIAERTYLLGWDCCHYAVPITMGGVVAGAAGAAT